MFKIYKINSHPTVDFAAEELKKYLRMMMTECGEIEISYCPDATDGFRLGLMSDFGIDTSEAADLDLDDILHIDTDCEGGIIAGSNVRSILLAVYKYLTLNGCRWVFPGIDGEFIPAKDIEPTTYHKMADNRYRGWCNEGAEFQGNMMEVIDYAPKIGLNVFMLEFFCPYSYYSYYYNHRFNTMNREPEPVTRLTVTQWKRQCEAEIAKRSLQFHDIGHAWATKPFGLDPDKDYAPGETDEALENAREYIALVDGKRELVKGLPMYTNFCMSRPDARRKVVDEVAKYCEKNGHVDYLHVWLGDSLNHSCECEECVKKTHSDWYVILLNEIDAELTKRNLNNRLVLALCYDSLYPPVEEKLNNPARFSMLLAPITRSYTRSVSPESPKLELKPYVRNKNEHPRDPAEPVAYAEAWRAATGSNVLLYEYHFWVNMVFEPTGLRFAEIINGDVKGYRAHGFGGIIEDGTQRPFFPNGLPLYTYAQTLFDSSLSFEEIRDDYFKTCYGEDFREVVTFFASLVECFDHKYLAGEASANKEIGQYYNPAMAEKFRKVADVTAEFAPFIEAHKNMPMRAQTVSYRLLRHFLDFANGYADFALIKSLGGGKESRERYYKFVEDFGKREVEIERYFDLCIFGKAMEWRMHHKKHEEQNLGI